MAPGARGVSVQTVHSFKGLESDAVVYPLEWRRQQGKIVRQLAYIAMSRARAAPTVLGTHQQREALSWPKLLPARDACSPAPG